MHLLVLSHLRHYAKWDADTKVIRDGLASIVFESHPSLVIIASILHTLGTFG